MAALLYFYLVIIGMGRWGLTGGMAIFLGLWGAASVGFYPGFLLSSRITQAPAGDPEGPAGCRGPSVICVEAGLALNQAFQRVATEIRHASELLTLEISQMNLEIRAGTPGTKPSWLWPTERAWPTYGPSPPCWSKRNDSGRPSPILSGFMRIP